MFIKSARFYDHLYHFKDYRAASEQLRSVVQKINPNAKSLLDVGCGTGQHLAWLRDDFLVEGLDINAELLDIARSRCPGVRFHEGNMVNFELDHTFDVIVCLFSSIGYVKTLCNLEQTFLTMARHLNSTGIILVEPWFSPESYWVDKLTANFVDEPDLKISWMYISAVEERVSIMDIHFLIGTPQGISCFTERHEMGLFTHMEYQAVFQKAGLLATYDPTGFFGRGLYIARNQADTAN